MVRQTLKTWGIRQLRIRGEETLEWISLSKEAQWEEERIIYYPQQRHDPVRYRHLALLLVATRVWSRRPKQGLDLSERLFHFWLQTAAPHHEYQLSVSRLYDRSTVHDAHHSN